MSNQSRRKFLQGSAAATASLPFLPLLRVNSANAATNVAPLRLIQIHTPFQFTEPFYHPQVSSTNSALAPAGSSFYLSYPNSSLAPLAAFQSDLIIFRGLKYSQGPNSHSSGVVTFTGANGSFPTNSDPSTSGTSIENYLFSRMAQQGSLSPFMAGLFTYLFGDHNHDDSISFNAGNSVGQIDNPINLYNSLFSNFSHSGSGGPSAAAQAAATRRQQTLGLVQNYLNNVMGLLPSTSPSYSVLQSHLSAAKGLFSQIAASLTTSSGGSSCAPPTSSSITNDSGADDGSLILSNANGDIASFIKIITQAFACDITRFGSWKMSDSGDPSQILLNLMPGLTNWNQNNNFHAQVTHATTASASNVADVQMAQFKAWYHTQVASLLTALKSVADPYNPSQTLYDNTVVLIGSEGPCQTNGSDVHGNGDPGSDQPFIIAGGCGGYFKKGQLILAGGSKSANVATNALLTNIVNTFETNQQQFNPAFAPKIINQYGDFSFSVSPTSWLA